MTNTKQAIQQSLTVIKSLAPEVEPTKLAAHDILLTLAPPLRLVDWLERTFDAKRKVGQEVPPEFTRWLERWQAIRADGASEIDYVTPAEWEEIARIVEGKPAQPTLLDVPAKAVYR